MPSLDQLRKRVFPVRVFQNKDGSLRAEPPAGSGGARKGRWRIRAKTARDLLLKLHPVLEALEDRDLGLAEMPRQDLHLAARAIQDARAAGWRFDDVFRAGMETFRQIEKTVSLGQLVEEFISSRENLKRSKAYLTDLRSRVGHFRDWIGSDCLAVMVTPAKIEEFLNGLKARKAGLQGRALGGISRRNYWRALSMMFNYAVRVRGYCRSNPVDPVQRPEYYPGDPETFTPAEVARILEACVEFDRELEARGSNVRITPWAAIKAFAGPRNSEMRRLNVQRKDLANLKGNSFRLSPSVVKGFRKKKPRLLHFPPNLRAWLRAFPPTHPWPYDAHKWVAKAAKRKGVFRWKKNGLRKTWESCAVALADNPSIVYRQSGHSVHVSEGHYDGLVDKKTARALFKIMPPRPAKIVRMPAVA